MCYSNFTQKLDCFIIKKYCCSFKKQSNTLEQWQYKLTPGHKVDAVVSNAKKGGVAVIFNGGLVINPKVFNVCLKLRFQL
jgi:hypothetical protein